MQAQLRLHSGKKTALILLEGVIHSDNARECCVEILAGPRRGSTHTSGDCSGSAATEQFTLWFYGKCLLIVSFKAKLCQNMEVLDMNKAPFFFFCFM